MEFFNWLQDSGVAKWIREAGVLWAYDLYLVAHAVGMAAVVGLSTAVALRILGVASRLPLAPMEAFFPFMFAGFWINAASGVVLFVAYPVRAVTNPGFYIKMGGVVLAVLCIRRMRSQVFGNPACLGTQPVPMHGKILAGTLLFVWWGTILAGRLLAYHNIPNVEWQASVAMVVATAVMLLAGFIAFRLWGWNRPLHQRI
jgi:hypothetical protein